MDHQGRKRFIWRTILFMLFMCFCQNAEIQAKVLDSGVCGEKTEWKFSEDGELNIYGSGVIDSFPWQEKSWWDGKSDEDSGKDGRFQGVLIKRIVIGEGITSIGDYAFAYGKYKTIQLPESLTQIGTGAFEECLLLEHLMIPDQVTDMKKDAFQDCPVLRTVQIPKQLKRSRDVPSFEGNYGIREVINHSQFALPVDTQEGNLIWKVNGKAVTRVAAGTTAKITPKKFRIRYELNGATLKGKKKTAYEFGEIVRLPQKVSKKGYIFAGWGTKSSSHFFAGEYNSKEMPAYGNVTLKPEFIRCKLTQDGGRTVRVNVDAKELGYYDTTMVIRYFTDRKKKNAARYQCIYRDKGTSIFRKLRQGKRYYFELCFKDDDLDWEDDEKSYWMGRSLWYPLGSVKIK